MPVNWDQTAYDSFYAGRIRWADATDPAPNANGERIGEIYHYGADFARYCERGPVPYWYYVNRASWLIQRLEAIGLLPSHRILIVGCGFGHLIYAFRHASAHPNIGDDFPLTYGIDLSSYIETNWDAGRLGDEAAVFDDWTANGTGRVRNLLDALTGGHTFHVILNWVTESYNLPAEQAALDTMLDACEAGLVGTGYRRIVNIVDNALHAGESADDPSRQTLRDYNTTQMTLAQWAAVRSTHSWLDSQTGDYVLGSAA